MQTLAIESVLDGVSLNAFALEKVIYWQTLAAIARSFFPDFWLLFTLTYSRGNYPAFLVRWRLALVVAFLLPLAVSVRFGTGALHLFNGEKSERPWWLSFSSAANAYSALVLIATVFILLNLAAKDFGRSGTAPKRGNQFAPQRPRRSWKGRPSQGSNDSTRWSRCSFCDGQWLRNESSIPERFSLPSVSHHEKGGEAQSRPPRPGRIR
jgi:hypothetical protein